MFGSVAVAGIFCFFPLKLDPTSAGVFLWEYMYIYKLPKGAWMVEVSIWSTMHSNDEIYDWMHVFKMWKIEP